jgi:hypothetical protein
MKRLITLLLLALISNTVFAEEIGPTVDLKEYDVEIIIFEDSHVRYLASQSWDQGAQKIDDNNFFMDKAKVAEEKTSNFKSIPPTILNEKYKRILLSSEYNILFYGSWRQAGLDKEQAFEIDIKDLENNHNNQSINKLSGNFKLILTRYLHIYSDLEYLRIQQTHPSENILENTEISDEIYPLKNHRRMRSKELHYIDHPLIGILVQINPVENKTEDSL